MRQPMTDQAEYIDEDEVITARYSSVPPMPTHPSGRHVIMPASSRPSRLESAITQRSLVTPRPESPLPMRAVQLTSAAVLVGLTWGWQWGAVFAALASTAVLTFARRGT